MASDAMDMQAVVERLDRLERQIRRLKQAGVVGLVVAGALVPVLMGRACPKSDVVEARQFIVKDTQGKLRVWLGVGQPRVSDAYRHMPTAVIASGDTTGLFLYDEKGREQTQLFATPSGGAVYINTVSGAHASLTGEGIILSTLSGIAAALGPAGRLSLEGKSHANILLDASPEEPNITVVGRHGKLIWSTLATNPDQASSPK
jgi:hypothetical protein